MTTQYQIFTFTKRLIVVVGFFLSAIPLLAQQPISADSLSLLQTYIQKYHKGIEGETAHDSTFFYLKKAEQLALDIEADSLLAEIRGTYAYFIRGRGKVKEAMSLFHKNIDYALKIKDSFLLMRTYLTIGSGYIPFRENREESIDSLLFYTQKGLYIAEQRRDTLHTLIARINLATFYKRIPVLKDKALPLLLNALELTDEHPEGIYFKSTAYQELATFYMDDGDYPKAIEILNKSVHHGKAQNSFGFLLRTYEELQKVYERTGDYQKSLAAYKEVDFYNEKIKGQEIEKKVTALEIQFETERKEHQINQLQLLNNQEKERSRRQQILLITLLLAGFLMGLLAYLAFKNYKKRQEAFLQLAANQKEMDAFKNRFYTSITHEFRTPLTVIQGMAGRILGNNASKAMILRNSQTLLQLVNQMLDLQKLEVNALSTNYIQNDIIAYLRYLMEPFMELAKNKAIHLTLYEETKDLIIDYDASHVKKIIDNLLSNALKFTPEKGEVLVHFKKLPTNFLQIKVKDNGIGMAKGELTAIFDRFYQIAPTNRLQSTGTGIGLALAKELVELMEGTIQVESEPNTGTTFTVLLPIQNKAALIDASLIIDQKEILASAIVPKTIKPVLNITEKRSTILLIEDNPDVIKFLQLTLQDRYEISTSTNGQVGLEKAWQTIPDLIISDVMMPLMDGLELCKRLKNDEKSSHIPIILLTAKATKANQIEGLSKGADAYLVKPFEPKELLIRIEKLLESRRKLQAYYLQWNPFSTEKIKPSHETPFLLKVKTIIEKHLSEEDFGVVQLCHALHFSRMQVHRKLKAVCDKSTAQFIREMRLQKAHLLLKTTDSTIAEIAFAVGFSDPNYFSKVFASFYGYSPSVTRK